jgi:hypothetical protein
MRRLIALTVAGVLGLTGLASAKTLVSYSRTGGLANIPLALTVKTGGKAFAKEGTSGDGSTATLSDKRMQRLKRALRRSDFLNLDSSYVPRPGTVADGWTERVTYKGKTVTAATGGDIPPELQQLLNRLATMATTVAH